MLYGKESLTLEKVTSTLLSNEIRKISNQVEQEGSSFVVIERKGRGEKKSSGSSKECHFYEKEGHWKKDCKHLQEWLKNKE